MNRRAVVMIDFVLEWGALAPHAVMWKAKQGMRDALASIGGCNALQGVTTSWTENGFESDGWFEIELEDYEEHSEVKDNATKTLGLVAVEHGAWVRECVIVVVEIVDVEYTEE